MRGYCCSCVCRRRQKNFQANFHKSASRGSGRATASLRARPPQKCRLILPWTSWIRAVGREERLRSTHQHLVGGASGEPGKEQHADAILDGWLLGSSLMAPPTVRRRHRKRQKLVIWGVQSSCSVGSIIFPSSHLLEFDDKSPLPPPLSPSLSSLLLSLPLSLSICI